MAQAHYTAFTVQTGQVTGTLTDFAFPIKPPNTARFKLIANGGHVHNGNDLRAYTSAAMTTAIPCELVPGTYDGVNGTFEMWVKPSSTLNGTIVYVGYGDSTLTTPPTASAVWKSTAKLALHMGNGTTVNVTDSTSNANNGNVTGHSPTAVAGQVGGGVNFNGTSQYIDFGDVVDVGTTNFTISGWFTRSSDGAMIDKWGSGSGWNVHFISGAYIRMLLNDTVIGITPIYEITSPTSFNHFAFSINRSVALGISGYINGVLKTPDGGGTYDLTVLGNLDNTANLGMGSRHPDNPGQYFGGTLDEPRIWFEALSGDWIGAEYRSQFASNTFTVMAAEDTSGGALPTPDITSMTPNSASSLTTGPLTLTGVAFGGTALNGTGAVFTGPAGFTFSNLTVSSATAGTVDITIATAQPVGSYTFTYTTSGGASSGSDTTSFTIASIFTPHFGYTNVDAESITLAAAGAFGDLAAQGWTYWATADSPEGAWMTFSAAAVTAAFTLPIALTAGTTYYIFLELGDYDDTSGASHRHIYFSNGGANSTTILTDDRDFNRYWSPRAILTPVSSSASMTMHVDNLTATTNGRLLRKLYITTNPNVTVTLEGTAVNLTPPTVMDNSAPVNGNLILNSSFELAEDAQWTQPHALMADLLYSGDFHSGSRCVRIACDGTIPGGGPYFQSRIFNLKPNKTYTFSAWMKKSNASATGPTVRLVASNAYVPPTGFPAQVVLQSADLLLTTTWQRLSVSGYMVAYPTADYFFRVERFGNTPIPNQYVLIDDLQLEEGSMTTYAGAFPVEASISVDWTTKPGNIFYSSDTLNGVLTARNQTSSTQIATLYYEIRDYLNVLLRQGSTPLTLTANQTTTSAFDLSTTGKLGSFRVSYWIDQNAASEKEVAYAIIPPQPSGVDVSSYLATHMDYEDRPMSIFQRLGIKWNRDLHPGALVRWEYAEPVEGTFVYFDAQMQRAFSHNFEVLANLGSNDMLPYMDDGTGKPVISKWITYVQNMVAHYKTGSAAFPTKGVKYWELWNEPGAQQPAITADYYAQLSKLAIDAIEAIDSTAQIVAIGGRPDTFIDAVIAAWASHYPTWDWTAHVDAVSYHAYPQSTSSDPALMTKYVTTNGRLAWNTESGLKTWGNLVGAYSNWTAPGKPILPYQDGYRFYNEFVNTPALVISEFVRGIAALSTKYFFYAGGFPNPPDYQSHEYTMIARDGSINTKGVAFAIAGSFIDHATGHGNVGTGGSRFYSFTTTADPVAVLVSSDFIPRQVVLGPTVTHAQLALYDFMGNSVTFTGVTIPYGRQPVYLKGVGIPESTLRGALQTGSVITTRTDAAPPNVMIAAAPRTTAFATFRCRWFALDDTSYPAFGEFDPEVNLPTPPSPDAIQYQYRLNPYSSWSAWSAQTWADYVNVPDGVYSLEVKARDAALNESSIVTRTVTVAAAPTSVGAPTIGSVTPTSAIPNPLVPIILQGVQIAGSGLNGAHTGGPSTIAFSNPNVTVSGTPTRTASLITLNVGITAAAGANAGTISVTTDGGTAATGFIVSPTPSGS